jgi:hypothetical protein
MRTSRPAPVVPLARTAASGAPPRTTPAAGAALAAVAACCLLAAAPPPARAQGAAPATPPAARPPAATSPAATPGAQCPVPPRGQAAPTPAELGELHRISDFVLVLDGRQQPAEIYMSERGAGLVISPALTAAVVLRARVLATLSPARVERRADGTAAVRPDAVLAAQGSFEVGDDGGLSFTVEGRQAALRPQPPLLGLRRVAEVTEHNPEYAAGARGYLPNRETIAALQQEPRAVTVRIYYGSWCSHCRKLVPNGVRVEQELRASRIRFEYYGVRRPDEVPGTRPGEGEIPTAVVTVNGAEAGRIVGDRAWAAPEVALREILGDAPGRGR